MVLGVINNYVNEGLIAEVYLIIVCVINDTSTECANISITNPFPTAQNTENAQKETQSTCPSKY